MQSSKKDAHLHTEHGGSGLTQSFIDFDLVCYSVPILLLQVNCLVTHKPPLSPYTGWGAWSWIWVGLTLICMFHHVAHLHSRFSQTPICPSTTGNVSNLSQPNLVHDHQPYPVQIWPPFTFTVASSTRVLLNPCRFFWPLSKDTSLHW